MNDFSLHDLNVFMALAGLLVVGIVLAGGALLYEWFARKHQQPHPRSH